MVRTSTSAPLPAKVMVVRSLVPLRVNVCRVLLPAKEYEIWLGAALLMIRYDVFRTSEVCGFQYVAQNESGGVFYTTSSGTWTKDRRWNQSHGFGVEWAAP